MQSKRRSLHWDGQKLVRQRVNQEKDWEGQIINCPAWGRKGRKRGFQGGSHSAGGHSGKPNTSAGAAMVCAGTQVRLTSQSALPTPRIKQRSRIPRCAGEVQHRRCHTSSRDSEHAAVRTLQLPTQRGWQRFIKVNEAAEEWIVKVFARQEWTCTSEEMVEKKGAIEKCKRIRFEIINQKNNHCSNGMNTLQVKTFLCLRLNL